MLAACGERPSPDILRPVAAADPGARRVDVLVATTRRNDPDAGGFGWRRAPAVSFQQLAISIPPNHKSGHIEWPDGAVGDPARHFVTLSRNEADDKAFRAALSRRVGATGEVLLFVHGYNVLHQEGVYRLAQIAADSGFRGVPVLFSWPSRGAVAGYVHDRESANYSRDDLERVMRMIAATPGVRQINVLAHSMGNWLAVETLRQAKIKGDMEFGGKLGHVMLASPDIDIDVFRTQLDVIGRRKPPIVIFIARDDRALAISRRIAGDIERVGAATDTPAARAAVEKYGLLVVDATGVEGEDNLNHGKFADTPAIVRGLGQTLNASLAHQSREPIGVVVLNAAGDILSAPKHILDLVTQGGGASRPPGL